MPQSIFRWKVVFWPKDNYSEEYFFEIKFSAPPYNATATIILEALGFCYFYSKLTSLVFSKL